MREETRKLTEQDKRDGKEIANMIEQLDPIGLLQVKAYMSALRDRQMMEKQTA